MADSCVEYVEKPKPKPKEKDIYRETPVRLLGYANEVGEAFRALIAVNAVRGSYVIASAYVVADTFHKGAKAAKGEFKCAADRRSQVAKAAVDTLAWQSLASVIVPGFVINRICNISNKLLSRSTRLPLSMRKWSVTLIGLASIPFIILPIDMSIHVLLNSTLRPYMGIPPHPDQHYA